MDTKKHLKCVFYADRFTHGGNVGRHIGRSLQSARQRGVRGTVRGMRGMRGTQKIKKKFKKYI